MISMFGVLISSILKLPFNSKLVISNSINSFKSFGKAFTFTDFTLEINLPPLEKQQKIVNYIDTANKEIGLLNKLIDEKNKLKTL